MPQQDTELTVWIGGAAGDGIASAGESFSKACARSGYHVFAYNSYQSAIRGGHVCMHVRIGTHKVHTPGDTLDYLLALNQDTFKRYAKRVQPGGAVFYNTDKFTAGPEGLAQDVQLIGLPVMELVGNQLMQNTTLMGAFLQVVGVDPSAIRELLRERFANKGEAIVQANLTAFEKGGEFAKTKCQDGGIRIKLGDGKRRLLAAGNALVGLGAVAAGCRFYAAYPMTPASSLLHWLAAHGAQLGVLVKQAEDEIAALNMTIGAAHVGARAMCGTSGGGFCLMTEAVGEAAMTEVPVVILNAQRGGPSTGLPTKTEQGDLFQMLGASQGDYPKILIAPRTLTECYEMTHELFNLVEKYQCPGLIATDLYLAERNETVDGLDITNISIDRGELVTEWHSEESYRRFQDTETGVSPRAFPGTPGTVYVAATDEHDEDGVVISDVFTNPAMRVKMMDKRMRKIQHILREFPLPKLEGPAEAPLTLVGWGSTYGVLQETMAALKQEGVTVNILCLRYLWPFQADPIRTILQSCKMLLAVEGNYTGQLAKLIRMETCVDIPHHLHKYDGEPFEPGQVIARARELLKEQPKKPTTVSVVSDEGLPPDFSPIGMPPSSETVRVH